MLLMSYLLSLLRISSEENDSQIVFFFIYIYLFNLFLAVLGLRCCVQAFSRCGEWELLLVAVCVLLIAVASLVAEHGL